MPGVRLMILRFSSVETVSSIITVPGVGHNADNTPSQVELPADTQRTLPLRSNDWGRSGRSLPERHYPDSLLDLARSPRNGGGECFVL